MRLAKKHIENFLNRKSPWINKTIHFNRQIKKSYIPKNFTEGEKFLYLGQEYPLILRKKDKGEFILKDAQLLVAIPPRCKKHKNYISKKLVQWYKAAAYKNFIERVSNYEKIIGVNIIDLKIRTLTKSWGNCSKKGVVSLTWNLIMAPLNIIDYVIVHELCHLVHPNHSPNFWKTVSNILPHYKQCKQWLAVNEAAIRL